MRHIPAHGAGWSGADWRAVDIKISVDFQGVVDALNGAALQQVPFVMSKTLNTIAKGVQDRIKQQLPVKFDRPTPFTQKGVFMTAATKALPSAHVFFPNSQEQMGKAEREYIRPGAQGAAARHQKKTEFLLTRMGFLPAGWVTVPGSYFKDGKLDGYGNISGAYYKQMIRALQIKTTKGPPKPPSMASQKRAARMGVSSEFFAVGTGTNKLGNHGGWLPSGVYKRTGPGGRKLAQYLLFVKKASYKQRLDLQAEAQTFMDQGHGQKAFDDAVKEITDKFPAR